MIAAFVGPAKETLELALYDLRLHDETADVVRSAPGWPDLMHHKYVVRDRDAVWTGSTHWTEDVWTREENVIVVVASRGVAIRNSSIGSPTRSVAPNAGCGWRRR